MWQINMGHHVSKMYGHNSKFHVFWNCASRADSWIQNYEEKKL